MAKTCPECGVPIDPEWATEEAREHPLSSEDIREKTAQKGGFGRGLLIAAVVLLGLLIGGLYYYDYRASRQREQRAYELLQGCSNPDFYEDFIIRYPKSQYIEDVRARYKKVAMQQDEWQKLVKGGSREELQQFVNQHATSPYVKIAQTRIDSLDWAEAKRLATIEAVTHYMATHADGDYIDQAELLRQSLERKRAEAAAAAARRDSLARVYSLSALGM